MTLTMKESDTKGISYTLAFIVMPDHMHWLFQLKAKSLSSCVQGVKPQFAKQANIKVWEKGFYDHCIRNDESLIRTARYIVANPLRANLVSSVED